MTNVVVNVTTTDFVENEDGDPFSAAPSLLQQSASDTVHDVRFRSTSDEEFDSGYLGNRLSQRNKDAGFMTFILALIEGIDHDHG